MTDLSYEEAVAQVTAPGERYETASIQVRGVPVTVFVNAHRTLRDLLAIPEHRRDRVYVVYEDEQWTFGDLERCSDTLSVAMVDRYEVTKGARVMIAMRNHPEWICAYRSIVSIGAIAVTANAWWTTDELGFALRDSEPTVVIIDEERFHRMADDLARMRIPAIVIRGAGSLPDGAVHLNDLAEPTSAPMMPDLDPDDDATIVYTSGTTGSPKGAVSTHRAITQAVWGFGCRAAVDRRRSHHAASQSGSDLPPCFILTVPLFHVTGCIGVMLPTFLSGHKLVMMHRWDVSRALELIERERVTNFVGVPTMSWDLVESPDFAKRDTSSLRSLGGGGAPAPPEMVRRVRTKFPSAQPSIGYGMTETNSYGPQNTGGDYSSRPTSAGRATPILQVAVIDEVGSFLPPGVKGEITFRGPNLFRGYWRNEAATRSTLVDGWLRTGDIGRIDEDGYVYVEDRAKDMVIRGGENVYCAEVEAAAFEHPGVNEVAVLGLPHDRLGEEVAMVVRPREGHHLEPEALREFLRGRLAGFKVPTFIEIAGQPLPRNAAGKVKKTDLKARLVAGGERKS